MSRVFDALKRGEPLVASGITGTLEDSQASRAEPASDEGPASGGGGGAEGQPGQGGQHDDLGEWDAARVRVLPVRVADAAAVLSPADGQRYAAEEYRIVRTKVVQRLSRPFRLVITSPSLGDGKTVTAVNLAAALALSGEGQTLLIDSDLRRAGVHRRLQAPDRPGLAEVLAGTCRLQEAVFRVERLPALYVLPAGNPDRNPTELLDSSRWRALAERVGQRFAHVIVDCPPVGLLADYDLIAGVCDGVALVVRPDHTDRQLCLSAYAKVRPKLTGVVINATEEWCLWKPARDRYYCRGQNGKRRGLSKGGPTE